MLGSLLHWRLFYESQLEGKRTPHIYTELCEFAKHFHIHYPYLFT